MTFTVTNTNDTGTGSLRQAITDANNHAGLDTVAFNIPGSGVHTITPASTLPSITDPVIIDGYTQPGASANTLATGDNAVLLIELNTAATGFGLNIIGPGSGSTIRGLVINRGSDGIELTQSATNCTIEGNFIGTDPTGTNGLGNLRGIANFSCDNNLIGGTTPAARNIISANSGIGVLVLGGSGNIIQGNFIGTDVTGANALGNGTDGINVQGPGNLVGGTTAAARNIISGNVDDGVAIVGGGASGNTVQGNFIGTDVTGTQPLGNLEDGVLLATNGNNTVGGTATGARNIISGNNRYGVILETPETNSVVQGNFIGTDITGTLALGNGSDGVVIDVVSNASIGGTAAGASNIIAHNGGVGLDVLGNSSINNAILGNSIFDQGGLGIDLGGDGVTANDHCDTDTGANDLQNYPVITSASFSGGMVTISGTLDSTPNTTFHLEFFSNAVCDPSGFGQGQTFLGSTTVMTDGSCSASFGPLMFAVPNGQHFVTATATDPNGNTSEFSARFPGGPCAPTPTSAVSRKTHGSAGTFDVDLLPPAAGIECRSGGSTNDYQMIIDFMNPVTVESASVTSGTGSVSSFSVSGSEVTVNLTGVINVQRIAMTLHNVNDGTHMGDVPVSMGVLVGDVNGNAVVNASDVSLTKAQVGQAVSGSNFREDVNANGTIGATDVALVKSKVGTALPP